MAAKKSFESELEKLEKITEELESGDISLEASLKKFDEGLKSAAYCSKQLENAKAKIELLQEKDGRLEAVPFTAEREEEGSNGY